MHCIINFPRFHADEGFGEVDEVVEGASHWGEDAGDTFLAGHGGVHAHFRPPARGAAERVDPRPCRWSADGTCDVTSDTDAGAVEGDEGSFAARAAARGVFGVVWVLGYSPQ